MIASFIIHYLGWQSARGFGGTCPKRRYPSTWIVPINFRVADQRGEIRGTAWKLFPARDFAPLEGEKQTEASAGYYPK